RRRRLARRSSPDADDFGRSDFPHAMFPGGEIRGFYSVAVPLPPALPVGLTPHAHDEGSVTHAVGGRGLFSSRQRHRAADFQPKRGATPAIERMDPAPREELAMKKRFA